MSPHLYHKPSSCHQIVRNSCIHQTLDDLLLNAQHPPIPPICPILPQPALFQRQNSLCKSTATKQHDPKTYTTQMLLMTTSHVPPLLHSTTGNPVLDPPYLPFIPYSKPTTALSACPTSLTHFIN